MGTVDCGVVDANSSEIFRFTGASLTYKNAALICFSHLRWDFVYQRPQHLLTRFAAERPVYFFEEPVWTDSDKAALEVVSRGKRLTLLVPHLPKGMSPARIVQEQRKLLDTFLSQNGIESYLFWYYTPMALSFTRHLKPSLTVFDCMDELSHFKGAPPEMVERERELLEKADVVFTGGQSLFEAKQNLHPNIHCFPSSIDKAHFEKARLRLEDPSDQAELATPRIGFFGVLDERLDIELLRGTAALLPDCQFVLLGPVVKIDPAHLPQAPNLHYLGGKKYQELPSYLSNWDVAMLPFARNDATRFISPTKTPEYLAAGKPVISTSIRDVVRPYGEKGLVRIADDAEAFAKAISELLEMPNRREWLGAVDAFLSNQSWDHTWSKMSHLMMRETLNAQDRYSVV